MKTLFFVSVLLAFTITSYSQKRYFTKTGEISFQAGTILEEIDGFNKTTTSIFDAATGQIEIALLVKGFEFKNELMQQHFNENYLESEKYPKSFLRGKIINVEKVDFQKTGSYPVTVKGTLELHGVSREVETEAVFKVLNDETVTSSAEFSILLEDYKIDIPGVVKDKIAKTAKIQVYCSYSSLKQ
jgi:YceI-like domain